MVRTSVNLAAHQSPPNSYLWGITYKITIPINPNQITCVNEQNVCPSYLGDSRTATDDLDLLDVVQLHACLLQGSIDGPGDPLEQVLAGRLEGGPRHGRRVVYVVVEGVEADRDLTVGRQDFFDLGGLGDHLAHRPRELSHVPLAPLRAKTNQNPIGVFQQSNGPTQHQSKTRSRNFDTAILMLGVSFGARPWHEWCTGIHCGGSHQGTTATSESILQGTTPQTPRSPVFRMRGICLPSR